MSVNAYPGCRAAGEAGCCFFVSGASQSGRKAADLNEIVSMIDYCASERDVACEVVPRRAFVVCDAAPGWVAPVGDAASGHYPVRVDAWPLVDTWRRR